MDKTLSQFNSTDDKMDNFSIASYAKELLKNPIYVRTIKLLENRLFEEFCKVKVEECESVKLKFDALVAIDSAFRTIVAEAEYEANQKMKGETNE